MYKTLLFLLVIPGILLSQAEFDVEEYFNYLETHKDMTYQELLDEYPAGNFDKYANSNFFDARFSDSIYNVLDLTQGEIELLNQHSFVVTERKSYPTYIHALHDIYINDLPLYISSDMILNSVHSSFDNILIEYESSNLYGELSKAYSKMLSELNNYEKKEGDENFNNMLLSAELYLRIGYDLLSEYPSNNVSPEIQDKYDQLMEGIEKADGGARLSIFPGTEERDFDFSQFTVRGHYTASPKLGRYFKSMIWLGRTEIYLKAPKEHDPNIDNKLEDIKKQTRLAFFITHLANKSGADNNLEIIDKVLETLIGRQDNITYFELSEILENHTTGVEELLDDDKLITLRDKALELKSANQSYNSQILFSNPMSKEQIEPAKVFMLMGQRPIIDGFVTANMVYDRILYNGEKIKRMLPSSLDVLFAFGNDAAIQALEKDLSTYPYSSNLAAVRYLINSYPDEFWQRNVYNSWLAGIRSLNPPSSREVRNELPEFMRTAAWWEKTMNTQLGSWTELRHDFLLYAKQSYSAGIGCDYPDVWIEPVPEMFNNILNIYKNLNEIEISSNHIKRYIDNSVDIFERLRDISKRAKGSTLTAEDIEYLKEALCKDITQGGCAGPPLNGWYTDLFFGYEFDDSFLSEAEPSLLVADIHTAPTDEDGNNVGWVKHIGTGPINLCVISTENNNGEFTSFVGPVYSFYEFTTNGYERLTDEKWQSKFYNQHQLLEGIEYSQTDIAKHYLADVNGNAYNGPVQLNTTVTSVEDDKNNDRSKKIQLYPNPADKFVNFSIPVEAGDNKAVIEIFSMSGKLVQTNSYNLVSTGNHLINIKLDDNIKHGNYLYKININDKVYKGKFAVSK